MTSLEDFDTTVHEKYMITHKSTAIWLSGLVPKIKSMHALMGGQMKLNMSSEGKPHIWPMSTADVTVSFNWDLRQKC